MGPERPLAAQPEPNPRIARIANLVGDMPGEPFLRPVERPKKVFPTLSPEEANRLWPVFEEARQQFLHLLRGRRLEHTIPDDVIADMQFEGGAKAVRSARGHLTPAYVSNAMRFELSRYFRIPEGRGRMMAIDANPDHFEEALAINPNHVQDAEAPEREGDLRKVFLRQPSLSKKRIYYAVTAKNASPKKVGALFRHSKATPYTTREVNRVVKQVQGDLAFTNSTGQYRDRQIKKALMKCIPDDRHREAMELSLTNGMSTRQLGEKYNVSHVAVYKWIRTGRERLIAYLRQHQSHELLVSILSQFKAAPR